MEKLFFGAIGKFKVLEFALSFPAVRDRSCNQPHCFALNAGRAVINHQNT